jgi:protocatechuate 3,4-dioxygenase beta subunit
VVAAVPIAILTIALTSVNAAQSTTPTAPRTIPPTEGVMQGHVVDAASGHPLRSVTVEMIGPERAITVTTGEDGKYEASGLEPGKYRVTATLTDM